MDSFSFEEAFRVAVIGPLEFIKGVQWEINKRTSKKIELFQLRLGEGAVPTQLNGVLYFVEHGAQVPLQFLKSIPRLPSIAVFESMNSQQVLGLGQVGAWRPLLWEEARYDKVATVLLEELALRGSQVDERIVGHLKTWMRDQGELPTRLVWTNCPSTWKGQKEMALSTTGAPLVLGSLESTADFKLPLSGKGEWALLQKTKHGFQFRSLLPQLPVQFFGDPSQFKSGDRLKIFDFTFELAGSPEWAALKSFMRRQGISMEAPAVASGPRTLADSLRELLENASSGELQVKCESRTGYITLQNGYIEEVLAGPVSGLKALFRILSWPEVKSNFERVERGSSAASPLHLGALEFQRAYDRWKQRLAPLKSVWPPYQLKVKADPGGFLKKKTWVRNDYLVFSSLCESERVFEVLNNCPLLDVEIIESLVSLRKDGLVLIHS